MVATYEMYLVVGVAVGVGVTALPALLALLVCGGGVWDFIYFRYS